MLKSKGLRKELCRVSLFTILMCVGISLLITQCGGHTPEGWRVVNAATQERMRSECRGTFTVIYRLSGDPKEFRCTEETH